MSDWINVKDELPENIGCYLCYSNDGWQMVCFINALGKWMLRPGGYMYGDLDGRTAFNTPSNREITHWRKLPEPPKV